MLLFKTILVITIACIILIYLSAKKVWDECILAFSILAGVIGVMTSLILGLMIFQENNPDYIQEVIIDKTIEYNGLIRELELVKTGDESFDKSTVYEEVLKYNSNVITYKENACDPWLSGLYNKEIADNLQLIDF